MSSSSRVALKLSSIQRSLPRTLSRPRLMVQKLTRGQEPEVISFLKVRPLHTVFIRGFIYDNGLDNSLNRGTFYGCRGRDGQLQGVALIGHATIFEARTDAAIQAFGCKARNHTEIHMITGEQCATQAFWWFLARDSVEPRRICSELLFERHSSNRTYESYPGVRLATMEDLTRVMTVQSQMAFAESGVDPMEVDPEGFRQRCSRRIQQGRVWVCIEKENLLFKADVMFDTPDVIYLEGIYVDPRYRGKGYGLNCLEQLSAELLRRVKSLCLLVNEQSREAQEFYVRAGFTRCSSYSTIFLEPTSLAPRYRT